jgi:hypothetical protein
VHVTDAYRVTDLENDVRALRQELADVRRELREEQRALEEGLADVRNDLANHSGWTGAHQCDARLLGSRHQP